MDGHSHGLKQFVDFVVHLCMFYEHVRMSKTTLSKRKLYGVVKLYMRQNHLKSHVIYSLRRKLIIHFFFSNDTF
jgi:hypothetical protein